MPFVRFAMDDGLPDDNVRCLFQDRRGMLWIGCENGLSCYDGRIFRNYSVAGSSDPIAGNFIMAITEDSEGILWIASLDGGLTRLDPAMPIGKQSQRFSHNARDPLSIPTNRLRALYDYNERFLMIGAELYPVMFLDKKTLRFYSWTGESPLHPDYSTAQYHKTGGWCHTIHPAGEGRVVVSFLHLFNHYLIDTCSGHAVSPSPLMPTYHGLQTYTSFFAGEKFLFAGGWQNGLSRSDYKGGRHARIELPDEVHCLSASGYGGLLAGTFRSGLYFIDTVELVATPLPLAAHNGFEPPAGRVNCLLRDRDGAVWAGAANGLYKHYPPDWRFRFQSLQLSGMERTEQTLFDIQENPSGVIRVLSSLGLFEKYPEEMRFRFRKVFHNGEPLKLTRLVKTPSFGWLLGTENGLYKVLDTVSWRVELYSKRKIQSISGQVFDPGGMFQVRSIHEDTLNGRPCIVLGVLGYGIAVVDPQADMIYFADASSPSCRECLGNNLVRHTIPDGKGSFWVATSGGLYHWAYSRDTFTNRFRAWLHDPKLPNSLASDDVSDLYLDPEKRLWIATRNGLSLLEGDSMRSYRTGAARHNVMLKILPRDRNTLWIATSTGLEVFDIRTRSFYHVPVSKMPFAFKPGARGCVLQNGDILLAVRNGLVQFNPIELLEGMPQASPYITKLSVSGQNIAIQPALSLAHSDYLTLQLSALHLHAAQLYELEYQWEGLAPVWQPVPAGGNLLLAKAPTGDYRLKVRAIRPDGRSLAPEILLSVSFRPPFWKSWQFILIAATALLLLGLAAYRYRVQQLMARQAMRLRIAGDLHDEVGSALSSISIGSELAGKFMQQEEEKARHVLHSIQRTARQTLENMTDIIWAIHPKQDSGEKIVLKMRENLHDLLEARDIVVRFEPDPAFERLRLSMESRKNLFLFFKEAIHNISRHAEASEVLVRIGIEKGQLLLDIQDDGKGFEAGQRAGNGMDTLQRRADELHGVWSLQTAPGAGTRVLLRVAINKITA